MRALPLLAVMLLTSATLGACQSPDQFGQHTSSTCPFVGGPNNNPYGSRDLSNRMCQPEQDRVAKTANTPPTKD